MKNKNVLRRLVQVAIVLALHLFKWKKTLNQAQKNKLQQQWAAVKQISDATTAIIEAEKVFTSALRQLGYTGTFAQQWKRAQHRFGKREAVWQAHKLRNRIVHEPGKRATKAEADFVLQSYYSILRIVL